MTALVWTGIAIAAALAFGSLWAWLWPWKRIWTVEEHRGAGDRFLRIVAVAIGLTMACAIGSEFVSGWWQLPFWIVGIPAATLAGLLFAGSVLVTAVELDNDAEHMNRTLRRAEGGDEHG